MSPISSFFLPGLKMMRYQEIEQLTSSIKPPLSSIRSVYLLQVLRDVIFRIQVRTDTGCGSYCGRDSYERWSGQSVRECYRDDEAYEVPSRSLFYFLPVLSIKKVKV
jgi:hypothetical protein